MKICIIGGGHIGTAMACYFKHANPANKVVLQVRDSSRFSNTLKCNDVEGGISYLVAPDIITSDYEQSVNGADVVFIALPHFAIEDTFSNISKYVTPGTFVGVIPGSGGCEFFFRALF